MTRVSKTEQKQLEIQHHLKNLKALGYIPNTLKPIQNLERQAHRFAEDDCNGLINDEAKTLKFYNNIEGKVRKLFNCHLAHFYINTDPRGYSLKIDDKKIDRVELYRDMGGYGILSPDF